MSQNDTKDAILLRITRRPNFAVVPEHAIKLFDRIMERDEAEALRAHPNDEWAQIEFWKERILESVASNVRGVIAVYYHEYIAAIKRNDDPYGFNNLPPYGGEARAQRDAYLACTASLA